MTELLNKLLNEPLYLKILIGVVGMVLILGLAQLVQRTLTKSVESPDLRYRMRKSPAIIQCIICMEAGLVRTGLIFHGRSAKGLHQRG